METKKSYFLLLIIFYSFSTVSCAISDNPISENTTSTSTADQANRNATISRQASTDDQRKDSTGTISPADNKAGSSMNLFALIRENPNLSTLTELIVAADMLVVLESPANYTFFAPTNEAFAALPTGTLELLKQRGNKFELTNMLQFHIIPNRVTAAEMKNNMKLKTAHNEEVIIERDGNSIKVNGANVITTDVEASNGIVHVIDKVLLPPKK